MARRNHLDDFTRGRMIGKLEEGRTVTSVAAEFGINKVSFRALRKAFQTIGSAVRKRLVVAARGRHEPRVDRYIILQAKRGRRRSASDIAQQLSTATGRQVSRPFRGKDAFTKGAYSPAVLNAASR
ncbi:transposable element Tcb2 transposase [Trichonephila clavipes]|nr:transposable element Tcb2 transposase [Trichonephila clavipes]